MLLAVVLVAPVDLAAVAAADAVVQVVGIGADSLLAEVGSLVLSVRKRLELVKLGRQGKLILQ